MSKRPEALDGPDIRTLEMMLDYAIIEGAALRLPMFVLLVRAARLELMSGVGGDCGLANFDAGSGPTEPRSLAIPRAGLDGSSSLLQDW